MAQNPRNLYNKRRTLKPFFILWSGRVGLWLRTLDTYTTKEGPLSPSSYFGRDEATRTPDPYVPNVVRYQLRYIPIAPDFSKSGAKVVSFHDTDKFLGIFLLEIVGDELSHATFLFVAM